MDDVGLEREGEEAVPAPIEARTGVEPLAMVRRVQPLPLQPQVVTEAVAVEQPLQPRLVGAVEGQRLALHGREQTVGAGSIGTGGSAGARSVESAEQEPGAVAPHGQRQHRPHQLERRLAAEPQVAEGTSRDRRAIAEIEARLGAGGGAEDRLPLAKRIPELGVVAVEDHVALHRDRLLGPRRPGARDDRSDNQQ